jgi:hypothetical protein
VSTEEWRARFVQRYGTPQTADQFITLLIKEIYRLENELAQWGAACTGKHGSQVPCYKVELT